MKRALLLPSFALLGLVAGIIAYLYSTPISEWIWFATLILGGMPILWQTIRGMLQGRFASDIVAMLAIITAILLQESFAGAVIVLMQSGGEALEAYGLRRASSSLKALLERAPRIAFRKQEGSLVQIDVAQVKVGDILIVRPGDLIPVDGTVVQGSAEVDESALTGEPLAKSKLIHDLVFSGTVDVNGAFEMRADKISQESQYHKIVELVQKAQSEKAPIQRLADRYAIFFTPLTLLMGFIGYLLTQEVTTVLSVLVVATPCPLILATPLAILCGINRAAENGIIVKGGAPIEQVGKSRAVVFDKTGTITTGVPIVDKVIPYNSETAEELLYKTACIEQLSSHSVAKAILAKVSKKLVLPTHFQEYPGRGVSGILGEDRYVIGSHAFLVQTLGQNCMGMCREASEHLSIFIAKNGQCIGLIAITDHIRLAAAGLMEALRRLGIEEIVMLTGDSEKNSLLIAKQVNIDIVKADLLPSDKVKAIQQLKKQYDPITMVGDGINDAPALATATVGIAMGAHGSAISAEAADIVLLDDDIAKVKDIFSISRSTVYIAKQSIFIGMGLSFLLMVVAVGGGIVPAVGALLQEIIDVAVILNALRVKNQ